MDADTTPLRQTMQFKIRYLWSAFAAAAIAIFCLASPAGAWSAAEEGAVSIHATSGYGGSVPAVQVDSAGNIYACGHFRTGNKSYDVDPNPAVTVNVSVTGLDSSVISKYSPSGNLLWYLVLDADDDDQVLDCALNAAGTHLAVSGEFKGTMNFPGSAADIASAGGFDAYLALIATTTSTTDTTAPSGVLWGKTLGGTAVDAGTGVGFGSSNEVYVGGHFKGEVDINWGTGSADNRTSTGSEDVFLTKFAVDGSLQWSKTWGGTATDVANDVVVDRDSNDIYIGGYLGNTAADYDPGSGTVMIGGASGFTDKRRVEILEELQPLRIGEDVVSDAEANRWTSNKDRSWVPLRVERVVEVAYDQMEGQRLRHAARFLRWRPDRDPKSCTYDQLEVPVDYDVADVLAGGPDSPAGES